MYTHEGFSISNKTYFDNFQKHGLDDIKFYLQKFYMQDISLIDVVEKISKDERLKDKIRVIKKEDIKSKKKEDYLWLIIDRSIGADYKYPGANRYYMCYKQLYINENPYHIFDEDKPGWINHVTIPHTLAGAMLNIGRCGCMKNGEDKIQVVDPFVGSGTMFLEALKFDNINFAGGDLNEIVHLVGAANLKFFSLEREELEGLLFFILDYINSVNDHIYSRLIKELELEETIDDHRTLMIELQNYILGLKYINVDEETFSKHFKAMVQGVQKLVIQIKQGEISELFSQILIFATWKTYKKNECFYKDVQEVKDLIRESLKELEALCYRLQAYIALRERSMSDKKEEGRLLTYKGEYTEGCTINYRFLKKEEVVSSVKRIQSGTDVVKFLKQYKDEKVDLIITDPPYGFNTREDIMIFSKLYIDFIKAMVECLNDGGQIIMCLPVCSYSGKTIHVFAQKEMVYQQFIAAARENNMYIVEKKDKLPEPTQLYSFPFYWDSEKALRRDIIRLQFFNKERDKQGRS